MGVSSTLPCGDSEKLLNSPECKNMGCISTKSHSSEVSEYSDFLGQVAVHATKMLLGKE